MILQGCQTFIKLLERHKKAKADQALAANLDPRREELGERLDKLNDAAARFRLLLAAKANAEADADDRERTIIERMIPLPTAADFTTAVAAVREKLSADPFKVTAGKDYKSALKALDALTEQLRVRATDAWRDWVDRQTARIDDAELARYEKLREYTQLVIEIRELRDQVELLPDVLPATAEELEVARDALEELRRQIGKLPRTNDPEVRKFLDAASKAGGAPLGLLTEKVRQWLKDNKIDAQCRVIIR